MEKNFIDIKEVSGDIIGVGIDGSGNIIGKDISVVINQAQDYGLNLLSPDYFKGYKSTDQDLEDWKKGFSFKLEAIKQKKEFRRSVVDKIKSKLENDHRLLLLGESGTSKSTILMEIMCEYFDYGYKILYDFGESEIKNVRELIKFIEGLLKGGNKILVAVDNTHTERTSAIFYVMDQLSNYELSGNLRFILTARLPEFDWFVNDRLNKVEEVYRHSIRKFTQFSKFRYEVEFLTKDEIEQFIKKYRGEEISADEALELGARIFEDTKGHPIMVKFYVFGRGLEEDVKDRYYRYLNDQVTMQPDSIKIQTMLICSLLDIANLPITEKLLERMEVQGHAYDLEHAMLYQYSEGLWKTIHPRWDMELLSFLYNEKNKCILLKRIGCLRKALDLIFSISDESTAASIIQAMYDIASLKKIPINIVESTTVMPQYLSNETKCSLYLFAIASTYRLLQMYPQLLENCNKALLLKPKDITALNAKALALGFLKKYDEALECCNKITEIDPNDAAAYTSKGLALNGMKRYDEALECWKKAVDIDDNYVGIWSKKIHSLQDSRGYDDSNLIRILVFKLVGKGMSYAFIKKYDEALECSNKALELDPNNSDNMNNKAWALNGLKKYDEALECSNKALEINPKNEWAWLVRGLVFNGLKRHDEALECSNKALELDPNNDLILNNKAWALSNLGKNDEALECSNKALELDPNSAWAFTNKAAALNGLKRHDEALECSNKALELDPNSIPNWFMS
jgi:tetratricopeptide (TPR) repeat protein